MSGKTTSTTDDRLDGISAILVKMDQKFRGIDRRFDIIDERFELIDQRFDGIDQRFELIDQRFDGIDQRFEIIDRTFDGVAKGFNSVDEQFNKFTNHMVTNFAGIREELAKKADKADVSELYKLMDSIAKRGETDEQERLAMGHVQNRHDVWIHEVSDQGGFTLSDIP